MSNPRRAYDFQDYIEMLRRNWRWVLGPVFACLVVSTVVAYLLEDTYVSRALIRIVPQQIPDSLVQNASSQQLADHINAMAESILSRNTLTNLINNYHLYRDELKREPLEDVIAKMKTAITIRPTQGIANVSNGKSLPAMQVTFSYRDRLTAKAVCDDIVSRFMNQNSQESMETQMAASQFLKDEFDRTKRELDSANAKLATFRSANAGRLPEQMELNIQQMNSLTQRTSTLNDALNRNNGQRLLLESALRIGKDRLNAIRSYTPQSQAHDQHLLDLDKQIQTLQTTIEDMRDRYTDSFPDLQRARQQLAILQRQRDTAARTTVGSGDQNAIESTASSREKLDAQSQVESLESQLRANAAESQQLSRQLAMANADLRGYEARIQGVPSGDREYAELMHDRELAKQHYDEMEQKFQRASISMDMEKRKQGETLEVLDAPSLPVFPTAPKRALIIPLGPVVGLLIGLTIVAIRELRDSSLKSLRDARLYTQLPILGSIPLIENETLVRRRKRSLWLGWTTATIVGMAVMAGTIFRYYWSKA
jgi:polysaccharide biosynthesis transport protein